MSTYYLLCHASTAYILWNCDMMSCATGYDGQATFIKDVLKVEWIGLPFKADFTMLRKSNTSRV